MQNSAVQLSVIVELLGKLWIREVTPEMLAAMRSDEFCQRYRQLGGFIPDSDDMNVVDLLAIEYCELLIGPKGHISPVQSVWISNQFQSETASSMNRFFEILPGYTPSSNLVDHIGVQLDFLAQLLKQTDFAEPGSATSEIADYFAKSHLEWAFPFLDRIRKNSGSDFYVGLANVTYGLLQSLDLNLQANVSRN